VPKEAPLAQPESSRERPKPRLDKILKKRRAPPNSRSKVKAVSAPTSENGSASELDISLIGTIPASLPRIQNSEAGTRARNSSQLASGTGTNSANSSFDSVASAPAKFPPPPAPPVLNSRVVTISAQAEKLKFEREEREKERKRREKNEKSREQSRLKRTKEAREKKRQELVAEAEKNGIGLTEENLNAQVEAYMKKREVRNPFLRSSEHGFRHSRFGTPEEATPSLFFVAVQEVNTNIPF
jgi:hypothetical protein